jgi:plastocyanin
MNIRRALVMAIAIAASALGFPLAVATGSAADKASGRPVALAAAATNVGMYGTIVDPQDLSFRAPGVTVAVGDTVSWTNHSIVPHTATEDHDLWRLTGHYGATPINPPGVAIGATVQRTFAAGTYHYFCEVHPKQMHGVVAVPVTLSVSAKLVGRLHHHRRVYTVHVLWSTTAASHGQVFDIQRSGGSGFRPWLTGASFGSANFNAAKGTVWHVEARLRSTSDPSAVSDWSPDATIVAG